MFIASAATTVKFHEFPNGNVAFNYQPGTKIEGPVRSISWSKDGNWLALVPSSGLTEIVSVKDQLKLLHTIESVDEPTCATFQKTTKKHIGLGTKNGLTVVYDIKTRRVIKRFPKATSTITHVDFTAKDSHVVAGCGSGEIFLYSNVSNNLSSTFKVPRSESITALQCNPLKRNLILGGSHEGVVAVWDTHANKPKFVIDAHQAKVTAVAFSPVNTELVVSTGLDRQFCFYDVVGDKCIAAIAVDNSLTAVDFSDDAVYIAMASQNGKVLIYDSRNIQEPVHQFEAHKSSIQHLAFQNLLSSNASADNSSLAIKQNLFVEEVKDSSRNNSDLFGMFLPLQSKEVSPNTCSSSEADSFLAALGLDKDNNSVVSESTAHSSVLEDKRDLSKPIILEPTHIETNSFKRILQEKVSIGKTSTPPKHIITLPERNTGESPILASNNISIPQVQAAARQAVKEEMKGALEEMKNEMKIQFMQMRSMHLDMHFTVIKEFVKLDKHCNILRDICSDNISPNVEDSLVRENVILRRRVAYLEEQIARLILRQQNGTTQSP